MIWTNLRLDAETMRMLVECRDSIIADAEHHPSHYPPEMDVVPLPFRLVVRHLLQKRQAHTARSKKSRLNRAWNQTVCLVDSTPRQSLDAT